MLVSYFSSHQRGLSQSLLLNRRLKVLKYDLKKDYLQKLCGNSNGEVTMEEFLKACKHDPTIRWDQPLISGLIRLIY